MSRHMLIAALAAIALLAARPGLAADAKCPECGTVPAPAVK